LSGTGTIEEQICAYINANVAINYSKLYSKLNIVLGVNIFTVTYGIMYNWYTATDVRNITSSADWVVPASTDFDTLTTFLGGTGVTGGKIKETGVVYWDSPNTGATNETNLNVRGAGERASTTGVFGGLLTTTKYWCSNTISGTVAYMFIAGEFNSTNTAVSGYGYAQGISIRLLKTSTTLLNGETGTYTGNDGKTYRTICIGTQEWLADNLSETLYRNSDPIPDITDGTTWSGLTTGARCFYNNVESNGYPA
jgi:uncharacterized protein (TIGR02145 family)